MNWLASIDDIELMLEAPDLSMIEFSDMTVEDILPFMVRGGPPPRVMSADKDIRKVREYLDNDPRPPMKYSEAVKEEINELICGSSEKYAELRNRIKFYIDAGEKGILTLIVAFISTNLGLEAGAVSGFCALFLFGAKKIGLNAYCKSIGQEII